MMKKIICSLLLLFPVTALAILPETDKAYINQVNLLVNPGAEKGLSNWTASTPANFTLAGSNIAYGNNSFAWAPTANNETLTSSTVSIPAGALNLPGRLTCLIYNTSSAADITMSAWNGSADIGTPVTLPLTTGYQVATQYFTFPSSGSVGAQFNLSPSATGALQFDQCFLGGVPVAFPGQNTGKNLLVNSGFPLWQRTTSNSSVFSAWFYIADRWGANIEELNSSSLAESITVSQVAPTLAGSTFGLSMSANGPTGTVTTITIPPTFMQVLENPATRPLLNQTVSFSVYVKAIGSATQATLSVGYATSETVTQTAISSSICTINTSTFTLCSLNGVSIGTLPTSSGSVSFSVALTSTFTNGVGMTIEQPMANVGYTVLPWAPANQLFSAEVAAAQRFYEKSYNLTTVPGTVTNTGMTYGIIYSSVVSGSAYGNTEVFKVIKRTTPAINLYSPATGSVGFVNLNVGGDRASIGVDGSPRSFLPSNNSGSGTSNLSGYQYHWTADAEFY